MSANARVLKILKSLKADAPTADDYLAQEAEQLPQPGPDDEGLPEDLVPAPEGGEQPGPEEVLTPEQEAALPEDVRRARAKYGAFPRKRAQ